MGKVKEKKTDGKNPFGGIKLTDTAKNAPKELVRSAIDDGTMRIASQMRDTVQRDQHDEYGGSQIESAALDASGMTARGLETFARSRAEALFHHGNSRTDEESPEDRPEQEPNQEAGRDSPEEPTQEEPPQKPPQESAKEPSKVTPEEPPQESAQTTEEATFSERESVPETADTLSEHSAQPEQSTQPEQPPPLESTRTETAETAPASHEPPAFNELVQPEEPSPAVETISTDSREPPVETEAEEKPEKRRKSHTEPEPEPVTEKKEETWKPAYQDAKADQKHSSGRKTAGKETADETGEHSDHRPAVRQRRDRKLNGPKGRNGKPPDQQPEVREKGKKSSEQAGNAADMGRQKLFREKARAVGNRAAEADLQVIETVQPAPVGIHPVPENLPVSASSDFRLGLEPEYHPATVPDAVRIEILISDYHIPTEREMPDREQPKIRIRSDTPQASHSSDNTKNGRVEIKTGEAVKAGETANTPDTARTRETIKGREAVMTKEPVPQEHIVNPPDTPPNMSAADRGRREFIRERTRDAVMPQAYGVPIEINETAQTHPDLSTTSNREILLQENQQTVQSRTVPTEAQIPVPVTADSATADTATVEYPETSKSKLVLSPDNVNPIPATDQEPAAPRQDTMPVKTRETYVHGENPSAIRPAGQAQQTKNIAIRERTEKAGEKPAVKPDAKPAVKAVEKRVVSASHIQKRGSDSVSSPASSTEGPKTVKQKAFTVKAREGLTRDVPVYGGDRTEKPAIRQRGNGVESVHKAGSRIAGNPTAVVRQMMPASPQSVNGSQSVSTEQEQKNVKTREAAQRHAFVPVGGAARRPDKKQPSEAAHETGCAATDNMTGNPMDILCPDSPVRQNQALPVQPETVFPAQSMESAREFARKKGESGKPSAAADIKTRESVLQAQPHNTETVSSRVSGQTSQEPVRAIPDSQVKESPREPRKTVRTREGLIEEPKPSDKVRGSAAKSASGEHGSVVETSANLRGSDAAGASRDETVSAHASRIERGDTAAALSGDDAPASPAAKCCPSN